MREHRLFRFFRFRFNDSVRYRLLLACLRGKVARLLPRCSQEREPAVPAILIRLNRMPMFHLRPDRTRLREWEVLVGRKEGIPEAIPAFCPK